jgi:hypothetical protein
MVSPPCAGAQRAAAGAALLLRSLPSCAWLHPGAAHALQPPSCSSRGAWNQHAARVLGSGGRVKSPATATAAAAADAPSASASTGSGGPLAPPLQPGLYVVGTPIGNLEDIRCAAYGGPDLGCCMAV